MNQLAAVTIYESGWLAMNLSPEGEWFMAGEEGRLRPSGSTEPPDSAIAA